MKPNYICTYDVLGQWKQSEFGSHNLPICAIFNTVYSAQFSQRATKYWVDIAIKPNLF